MQTTLITIIACLFCSLLPANARVGETLDQCKTRYKELKPTAIANEYEATSGDITISLHFTDGVCGMVFYELSTGESLSTDAMLTLIQANFGNLKWDISDGVIATVKETGISKDKKYTWAVMRMSAVGPLGLLVAKQALVQEASDSLKQEERDQLKGL